MGFGNFSEKERKNNLMAIITHGWFHAKERNIGGHSESVMPTSTWVPLPAESGASEKHALGTFNIPMHKKANCTSFLFKGI